MAIEWKVNGVSLATKGLTFSGGSFRTHGVSVCMLDAGKNFDAAEIWPSGTSVILSRVSNGSTLRFFQGKIKRISKSAQAAYEGHSYALEDAWADLEATVYQEAWALGATSYLFPRFVFGLGLNSLGTEFEKVSVGQMIRNVLEYAASVGVSITVGSIPDGEIPIPSEMENMSCAEVIMTALKLHPDWIPWIDHSPATPTFNVTAIAAMNAVSIAVDGTDRVSDLLCEKRDEILPEAVRIVYEFATTIDDEVYRNAVIDKHPSSGPDGGPRVMGATIPLAGLQMQVQKSRIQTRTIPTGPGHANAKKFLIANYPHLSDLNESDFEVDELTLALIPDDEEHPQEVSNQALRIEVDDLSDVPRQLVRGQIEDWMRRKVGKVKVTASISAAEGASDEVKDAIAKGTPPMTTVATNATTKLYRGISQWVAPEDVPVGIAQAVYDAIHAACNYEGEVTISESEIGTTRYHGSVLNLTGGVAGWATMRAPVHSVDFDVDTGRTTIGFGPPPYLSPQDFLELQRILRFRPTRWWSFEERGSNRIGGEFKPSAAGDTVSGYHIPETLFAASTPGTGATDCPFGSLKDVTGGRAIRGGVVVCGDKNLNVADLEVSDTTDGTWVVQITIAGVTAATDDDGEIFLPGVTTTTATTAAMALITGTDYDDTTNPTGPASATGTIVIPIGTWVVTDGAGVFSPTGCGSITVGQCAGILNFARG